MEPEESCRICKKFFPLSLLQQHVNSGCHGTSCDHDDDHVQEGDVRDDIRKYYQFMIVLVQILGISYLAYSEQILSETSVSVAGNSTFGTAFIVSTSGSTGFCCKDSSCCFRELQHRKCSHCVRYILYTALNQYLPLLWVGLLDSSTSTLRSGRSTLEKAITTSTILGNSTYRYL